MRSTRAAWVLGAVTLAAVTACDTPLPAVTVFSGPASVRTHATCWTTTAAAGATPRCAAVPAPPPLAVLAGQTVGISVDTAVAAYGWVVAFRGHQLAPATTGTYQRLTFTAAQLSGGGTLDVIALQRGGRTPRGDWVFTLTPAP